MTAAKYRPESGSHIAIVNWRKYQGSNTSQWIKLWRETITSRDWVMGDSHDQALMIALLVLASQHKNCIPYDLDYIERAASLRRREDEDHVDISNLLRSGFIEVREGDAVVEEQSASPRRKGKLSAIEFREKNAGKLMRFDEFYQLYPRKEGRAEAEIQWVNHDCDEIADTIIEHLKTRLAQGWKREAIAKKEFGFIKLPKTYISNSMWEDQLETARPVHQEGELSTLPPGVYK